MRTHQMLRLLPGVVIGALTAAAWAGPPGLIVGQVSGSAGDADALRSRRVTVSAAALASAAGEGAELGLAFFDDAQVQVRTNHVQTRPGGVSIWGSVVGDPLGTFAVSIENGQVSGGVWTASGVFGLTPTGTVDEAGNPVCIARQVRGEALRRCAMTGMPNGGPEPVNPRDAGALAAFLRSTRPTEGGEEAPAGTPGGPPPSGACACRDDQSLVDVLVVYTPAGVAGAGGLAALQARLADSFASTNAAFMSSGVTTGPGGAAVNRVQMRMVGLQPIAYDEVAPEWLNHLERVTGTSDGFMDGVHAMRNTFKADLVSLVIEDARFTGGAAYYAVYTDESGFSVMNWRALGGGNLTFAHELGHNFGCAHDRGNSGFSPFQYAWGYSFAANNTTYGTIMSYTGATFVPQFSNPTLLHSSGQPLGAPLSSALPTSNALAIAQSHWTLASYRDATGIIDCNGNGLADDSDISAGRSTDVNGNCRPDECEYRVYVDADNFGSVDGLSWNTAYRDLGEALAFASMRCSNVSEIWVADGTYKPDQGTADRFARFQMRSGLAMVGGFQGKSRPGGGETAIGQRIFISGQPAFTSALSGNIGAANVATDNSFSVVVAEGVNTTAVLDGFTIREGFQDFDGAGMFVRDGAPTLRNVIFADNTGGGGAALAMYNDAFDSARITNARFEDNLTSGEFGSGGAVALRDGARAIFEQCIFERNASGYGGAVAMGFGAEGTFNNCLFFDNSAGFNSGAIDCFSFCTLNLADCAFDSNVAGQGGGGAIIVHTECIGTIERCTFTNNSSLDGTGGAAWIENSEAVINDCTFIGNQSVFGGGAATASGGSEAFFNSCTMSGNSSRWGGAIAGGDATISVRSSLLSGNTAHTFNGGGVDLFNCVGSLINTRILNNQSTDSGGAVWSGTSSNVLLIGCTLAGNDAVNSGGGVGMFDSTVAATGCIVYGNTAFFGTEQEKQFTVFSGTLSVDRSCVQGLDGGLGGAGNIGSDPLLVDIFSGDVSLSAGSPCIDAGDSTAFPLGITTDGVGNARFVDDPATTDTGVGAPGLPVADMGAVEFVVDDGGGCAVDFNNDGIVSPDDLDEFITTYFSEPPDNQTADFNNDGIVSPDDLDEFITMYFEGC